MKWCHSHSTFYNSELKWDSWDIWRLWSTPPRVRTNISNKWSPTGDSYTVQYTPESTSSYGHDSILDKIQKFYLHQRMKSRVLTQTLILRLPRHHFNCFICNAAARREHPCLVGLGQTLVYLELAEIGIKNINK